MTTPYRELSEPVHALAVAAALPPDAYHPRGRWSLAGRRFARYMPPLIAAGALWSFVGPGLLGTGAVATAYLFMVVDLLRRRRLAFRLVRASDEAVALLHGGDVDGAARCLDALAAEARGVGFYHALVVFNRGVAFVRQSEPEKALRLFEAVARSGWFERYRVMGFDGLLYTATASAHALLGDVPAAEQMLARAQARVGPASRGKVLPSEALVGLRRGEDRAVAARIDAEWSSAEGALPATQLRALRALQAFALARSGADEAEVQRALERARPVRAGELDHLGARWPALKDFLAARL